MNVSSAGFSSSPMGVSGSGGSSAAQIQKQIAALQQEIVKEQASKDDAKTKVETELAYQTEIAMLEQQLQQIQQRAQQEQAPAPNAVGKPGVASAASPPKTRQEQIDERIHQPAPYDATGRIIDAIA